MYSKRYEDKLWDSKATVGDDLNCGCGMAGWCSPGSAFIDKLRRYRIGPGHQCVGCSIPRGLFEDGIHMLAGLYLGRIGTTVVDTYHRMKASIPKACQHGVMAACKAMTGLMKMGGPYIHSHWRALCYWELQYGYVPEDKDMVPEIEEWLREENALGGPLGDHYLELMYEEARKLMTK